MKILDIISEVSRGDYYKKATMDRAMSQMSAGFARSPEEKEKHLQKAGRRERGLARAKTRTDKFWAEKNAKDQADALERDRARKPEMLARLKDLEAKFDPSYEYSDDYGEWHKHKEIAHQISALKHRLSQLDENATAGATSAGNVAVGPVYKNKPPKQPKNKDGTAKNALDMKANLLTGGSIKR